MFYFFRIMTKSLALAPAPQIEHIIRFVRGQKIILDYDLAGSLRR